MPYSLLKNVAAFSTVSSSNLTLEYSPDESVPLGITLEFGGSVIWLCAMNFLMDLLYLSSAKSGFLALYFSVKFEKIISAFSSPSSNLSGCVDVTLQIS